MQLTPRYEGPAVLRFDAPAGDLSVPLLRQRTRLGGWLRELDDAAWGTESRCAGWSITDVIAHLVGTDQFWFLSATSALAGEPTRILTRFDPVTTPAAMVDGMRDLAPAEVLQRYLDGVEALASVFGDLDDEQWAVPGEAPPGHVPLHAVARHALWDAWIHERDVVLPTGATPVEEPDEIVACLEYAAALGPAFLASQGSERTGSVAYEGTDPDVLVAVELGDAAVVSGRDPGPGAVRVAGPTVQLVEALSFRAPFPQELAPEDRWVIDGLATVFDLVPEAGRSAP